MIRENYSNDLRNGNCTQFYDNNIKHISGYYVNGNIDIFLNKYYESGNIMMYEKFESEKMVSCTEYYESGNIKLELNFQNGVQHGITNIYFENAQLQSSVNYVNGKRNGLYIEYDEYGNKVLELNYDDHQDEIAG